MDPLTDNPFAALTFIVAPALLTNASAVLLLSTSNRFARAVDRTRLLAQTLDSERHGHPARSLHARQLDSAERRVLVLVRALTAFYAAAGCFAVGTLIALLGATFVALQERELLIPSLDMTLIAGALGVAALAIGALSLVWETRMALAMLRDEAIDVRNRLARSGGGRRAL